ncbi:MAG: AzlD protein [Deltaproteobacteria bacterium]|nr:MAG: AzlD protein [Deltaproteobacteria bacterium]
MTETEYIILISGMGIVSFLPRWIPLFFLSRKKMPDILVEWLELIPASILSALLFPTLLTNGKIREFNPLSTEFIVAIPTFIFAWYTKSLAWTLVFGMILYWGAGFF